MRLLVLVLALAGIAGLLFIWREIRSGNGVGDLLGGATGPIAIRSVPQGLVPFDIVNIPGAELDSSAATSVVFTTDSGQVLTVPALAVTPSAVAVAVPPVAYDRAKGAFGQETAAAKVVQALNVDGRLTVRTSNEIPGIMILEPRTPKELTGKNLARGAVARLAVAAALESLKAAADKAPADNDQLAAKLADARQGMERLLAAITELMNEPKARVTLPAADGKDIALTADDLAWLDAFYKGFFGLAEERLALTAAPARSVFIPAAQAFTSACRQNLQGVDGQDPDLAKIEEMACSFTEPGAQQAAQAGEIMSDLAKFSYGFLLIPAGVAIGLLGAELALPTAATVALGTGFSLLTDALIDGRLPGLNALPGIFAAIADGKLDLPAQLAPAGVLVQLAQLNNTVCQALPQVKCLEKPALFSVNGAMQLYDQAKRYALGRLGNAAVVKLDAAAAEAAGLNVPAPSPSPAPAPAPSPKPSPAPKPEPKPAPRPSPVIVPSPSPSPSPKPAPAPTCAESRSVAYNKCRAGCRTGEAIMADYDSCQAKCDGLDNLFAKSDCSNHCIGAWEKDLADQSKCYQACTDAFNASTCF